MKTTLPELPARPAPKSDLKEVIAGPLSIWYRVVGNQTVVDNVYYKGDKHTQSVDILPALRYLGVESSPLLYLPVSSSYSDTQTDHPPELGPEHGP